MVIKIRQIHEHFVGEVSGLDLSKKLSPIEVKQIEEGMDTFGVLIFHNQWINNEQQIEYTKNFGELELHVGSNVLKATERRLSLEFADVSNLDQNGEVLKRGDRRRMFNLGNRLWHSDSSFRVTPSKFSLLSCRSTPAIGGNTEFTFMPAIFDALDEDVKIEIENLITEHSLIYSRGQLGFSDFSKEEKLMFAPVRHAMVRSNEFTGRKSIYLSAHIGTIIGWEMPEARDFIREMMEIATQRHFVYSHEWCPGDLIMWDNRQCMHRVRPIKDTEEKRDMRRTTVAGLGPTAQQDNIKAT
jgi:alpha-ketoglutarate-dependent 2,4-dichlorophenoxyacetate dioxygenase